MPSLKSMVMWDGAWERRAYRIVDDFERELCDFTGAPYAVCVNSCTNSLFLSLTWERTQGVEGPIRLPRCTYVGVLQSVRNAGFDVQWTDEFWQERGFYPLFPANVWDSARSLRRDYSGGFVCLSFHSAKQLPIGRGGAILTDNEDAAEWFRAARMDGRPPGGDTPIFPGWHMPMPPDVAARGLDILSRWEGSPPPLPHTDYPDLSKWWPGKQEVKTCCDDTNVSWSDNPCDCECHL